MLEYDLGEILIQTGKCDGTGQPLNGGFVLHNIENAAIQYRNMRLVIVKALNSYGKYNGG